MMKGLLFGITLSISLLGCTSSSSPKWVNTSNVGIVDGDTISLFKRDGSYQTIRLLCIDAPESSQYGGGMATQELEILIKEVSEVGIYPYGRDQYGRILAVIERPSGPSVNTMMILRGMAFKDYMHQCPIRRAINSAHRRASDAQVGVHGLDIQRPSEYRRERRQ
jgi:endonuclease YncB( thermonuclease family)